MPNPVAGTSIQNGPGTGEFWADSIVTPSGPNYAVFGGANNALTATISTIVPGVAIAVNKGLLIYGVLANTLQAGNNSLNLNSIGVKSIVGVGAHNLKTIFAVGAAVQFFYDGTKYFLMNSTY